MHVHFFHYSLPCGTCTVNPICAVYVCFPRAENFHQQTDSHKQRDLSKSAVSNMSPYLRDFPLIAYEIRREALLADTRTNGAQSCDWCVCLGHTSKALTYMAHSV